MVKDGFKGYVNGVAGIANAGLATATAGELHFPKPFEGERYSLSYTVGNVGGYTAAAIGAVGTLIPRVGTAAYVQLVNSPLATRVGAAATGSHERGHGRLPPCSAS